MHPFHILLRDYCDSRQTGAISAEAYSTVVLYELTQRLRRTKYSF